MTHVVNLLEFELEDYRDGPPGHRFGVGSLTEQVGALRTGLGIYELAPGQATWPYHFELNEEEWLIVLAGEVTLRTPDGERALRTGDVACFRAGAAGAHAVRNDGDAVARFAMPSSVDPVWGATVYPDEGTFRLAGSGFSHRGRLGEAIGYWEGHE